MRTKIHWARKSQQPLAMLWAVTKGKNGASALICHCTTDKKNDILTTDRVIAYFNYESNQVND